MNRTYFRLASVAVAVAVTVAACGKGKGTSASTTTTASAKDVAATANAMQSQAVQLRVRLTELLQASSYLTSAVVALQVAGGGALPPGVSGPLATPVPATTTTSTTAAAQTSGGTSGSTTTSTTAVPVVLSPAATTTAAAAVAALDQNSQALAAAVGAVYPSIQSSFLAAWRAHINAYFPLVRDVLSGDHPAQAADRTAIGATNTALGTVLNSVNADLVASPVADAIATTVTAEETAITAIAQQSNTQYDGVRAAGTSMLSLAELLAHGVTAKLADRYPGNVDSKAAFLVVAATSTLQASAFLTAQATRVAAYGGDAVAAKNALDANSESLSNIILTSYGSQPGAEFLKNWRALVTALVNDSGADAQGAAHTVTSQLTALVPNLTDYSFGSDLSSYVTAELAVASAQTGHSPGEYLALPNAAGLTHGLGMELAGSIAQQFPTTFTAT